MNTTEDYYDIANSTGDYNFYLEEPCTNGDSPGVEWAWSAVAGAVSVLGLLGNGLVVASCALYRRALPLMDVFLLNLALSDLLLVVALPLMAYNEQWAWPMGTPVCKMLRCCYSISLYSGALLLACISIDRYFAVVWSRRNFRLRTLSYGRVICGAVWVSALLLSIPTAIFYTRYVTPHAINDTQFVCEFSFSNGNVAKVGKLMVPGMQLTVGFVLPLSIMSFCYAAIGLTLMTAVKVRRRRALLLVLTVLAVFVVCHLPYNLVLLHSTVVIFQQKDCQEAGMQLTALGVTEGVAFLHCCLNPPLYAFSSQRFRNRLRAAMRQLRPASHSGPSDHITSSNQSTALRTM